MQSNSMLTSTYRTRAAHPSTGPLASYLLRLISIKKTNLCLSADVETSAELLALAEELGDSICILKTHCDIISNWTDHTARALKEIARRKWFIVFEDRKFADIGETVQKQYTSGHYRIASWAEVTNAHVLPGPAIITALHKAANTTIARYNTSVHTDISATRAVNGDDDHDDEESYPNSDTAIESPSGNFDSEERRLGLDTNDRKFSVVSISTTISTRTESISPRPDPDFSPDEMFSVDKPTLLARLGEVPFLRSLLVLAEMSSEGHLMTPEYRQQTLKMARTNRDFVMGFIAQRSLNLEPDDNFLTMTPGCKLPPAGHEGGEKLGDDLGQQYNTPHKLIYEQGADIIIVGRGIIQASDRVAEAERYRAQGWRAYEERVGKQHSFKQTDYATLTRIDVVMDVAARPLGRAVAERGLEMETRSML